MKQKARKYKLKRQLGLFEATIYGVGIILGAGIYALIGTGAGMAGNAVWISFILAAILAAFTGLSYAELSSMYPKEGAEYVYTQKAFRRKYLSFMVAWSIIISGIVAASTVALGFAGYFSFLFGGDIMLIAIILIILLSLVNYIGIKESAKFNIISSLIETGGLLLVIIIGLFFFSTTSVNVDFFEFSPLGINGIFIATALMFFAFIGFEDLVNISEETKKAKKVIPKALIFALIISTILYVLVAVSSVAIMGWQTLSESSAPLSDVVSSVIPEASLLMSIIALFATSNTVLILLIVASRIIFGVSRSALPRVLTKIGSRGTPYVAVFLVMIFTLLSLFLGNIEKIAMLTTLSIFVSFIFVNLSMIYLRYKKPNVKRPFKSPLNIGKFPVLGFLGFISSGFMLLYFEYDLLVLELILLLAGIFVYKLFNR